jgi:5,6-dimethylbenzimidazole synthase
MAALISLGYLMTAAHNSFSPAERAGLYRAIRERRDVRSQFLPDPIPHAVLARLLQAAHHAPSVGFMQPWDFIVIDSRGVRQQVHAIFERENRKALENYAGDQATLYKRLKLEGILESPLNLCITCDRTRGGPHVLGRNSVLEMDLFSVCLAVQNLWLSARAEGIGVGWVSILDQQELAETLKLPDNVYPVAYLCVGYVSEFLPSPELQAKGWRSRLPIEELVHGNVWGQPLEDAALESALRNTEHDLNARDVE